MEHVCAQCAGNGIYARTARDDICVTTHCEMCDGTGSVAPGLHVAVPKRSHTYCMLPVDQRRTTTNAEEATCYLCSQRAADAVSAVLERW